MNGIRGVTQMLGVELEDPIHPQASTSKRKTVEDVNPLNGTTKKLRRDTSTKSNKRKLVGEEKPGGLVIVRVPPARPPSSQGNKTQPADARPPSRQTSEQPTHNNSTRPPFSKPPSKKFRADVNGRTKDKDVHASTRPPDVDEDVRTPDGVNPAFNFPPPPRSSSHPPPSHDRIHDASHPLPLQETPQIQKNKIMRGEFGHSRRKSSISRGKRISSSFENTGVISQPHTSVSHASFHKHIDVDLPEPQRAQQLLIWCSHRAMSEISQQNASSSSSSERDPQDRGKDPPLSKEDAQLLKSIEEDVIKMLAEKKIDTSVFSRPGSVDAPRPVKENEQNVRNRAREANFNAHIQRSKQEEDAWAEVASFYNAYQAKVLVEIEKRQQALPSAKAKGKQRATFEDVERWSVSEAELPAHFHGSTGIALAKSLVDREAGRKGPLGTQMEQLEFTADHLHALAHSALETTRMAERDLDRRFAVLNICLAARSRAMHPTLPPTSIGLSSYFPSSLSRPQPTTDPQDLLRALSRVDAQRPQTQVGDAARRAAREVQRANDAPGGLAERRLTGVAPPTPRKPPGTPRRATTPGRGR